MRFLGCALWLLACSSASTPVATPPPVPPLPVPVVVDAAVAPPSLIDAAAIAAVSAPVDPMALPLWAIPSDSGSGSGGDVELYAANASIDEVAEDLAAASHASLLALATGGRITGRVTAPSAVAADGAFATASGFAIAPPKLAGKAAAIDLTFARAPQRDVLRILADTMHVNIVLLPEPLPDLDIVLRAPSDATLSAIAALDSRDLVRQGNVFYLLHTGDKLPPLVHLPDHAVDLDVVDGTAAEAFAALAGVVAEPYSACGGDRITLRLRRVTMTEAIRAIAIAARVEPSEAKHDDCRAVPGDKADLGEGTKLVAIAGAGTTRVAIVEHGAAVKVVAAGSGVEIGANYVTAGDVALKLHEIDFGNPDAPTDPDAWLATLQRVSLVMRIGARWSATIETAGGPLRLHSGMPLNPLVPAAVRESLAFSPSGVDIAGHHVSLAP